MTIIDLIIIFASGLSLVMALGLVVRPLYFRNMVLAIILALMGFLTFSMYLLHSQRIYDYPILFFFQIPVELCLGPLLYFYVESITGDKDRLARPDIIHFLPLLLVSLYLLTYFLYSPNAQRETIFEMINQDKHIMLRVIFTASVFSPVAYIFTPMVRILHQLRKGTPAEKKIMLLFSFLVLWVITGIVGIIGTISLSLPALKIINLLVGIVILGFYLLSQRYPYLVQYGTVHVGNESYSKSYLNGLDLENLNKQLAAIMSQEKLYCDEDLSLARLSQALGITQHQLSQFLNQHFNKNFNNFINGYRIEDAKKLLIDESDRNTLSIALAVGFNSYSAFHAAFRKATGLSPAEYRKKNVKNVNL
jgi:AraC-like DNA-binding protein